MKAFSRTITLFLLLAISGLFLACEQDDMSPLYLDISKNEGLFLVGDKLPQPQTPIISELTTQFPTDQIQTAIVKFRGANDDPIEGYLFIPGPYRKGLNFVVLLHGSGGALDGPDDNTNTFTEKSSLTDQYETWVDDLLAEGYGVFVINSFKGTGRSRIGGEADYIGVKPPNDAPFSPYRIRAEDVKNGIKRLKGLQDHNNIYFARSIALLGFSHGATAAISAVHDYSRTRVGGADEMMEWSVKHNNNEYDGPAYDAPFSNHNTDVKAAIAYYGGTYGFGYFTDYAQGQGAAYKYHLNKALLIHHGTADATISIGLSTSRTTPRGFEDHILQGNRNQGVNFQFMEWLDAGHSFDMPSAQQQADVDARNGARTATLNFLEQYIG